MLRIAIYFSPMLIYLIFAMQLEFWQVACISNPEYKGRFQATLPC